MDHNPEIAFYLDWIEENNQKHGKGFPLQYAKSFENWLVSILLIKGKFEKKNKDWDIDIPKLYIGL